MTPEESMKKYYHAHPEYWRKYYKRYKAANQADEKNRELGKTVRSWRRKMDWTQNHLGKMIGVSGSIICAYERAVSVVQVYRFFEIPELFRALKEVEAKWKK